MKTFSEYREELEENDRINDRAYQLFLNEWNENIEMEEEEIDTEYLLETYVAGMETLTRGILEKLQNFRRKEKTEVSKMIVELGCMMSLNIAIQLGSKKLYANAKKVSKA